MGKTNSTFVSSALRTLALMLVLGLVSWQSASAQCVPVTINSLTIDCATGDINFQYSSSASLLSREVSWVLQNTATDEVLATGENQSSVTGLGSEDLTNLGGQPGDEYRLVLTRQCQLANESITTVGVISWPNTPAITISNVVQPLCPGDGGSFDYEINVTGCDDGSTNWFVSVDGGTATSVAAGNVVSLTGLADGDHTVSITGQDPTDPTGVTFPITSTVTIAATDVVAPTVAEFKVQGPGGQAAVANGTSASGNPSFLLDLGDLNPGTDCCVEVDIDWEFTDNCGIMASGITVASGPTDGLIINGLGNAAPVTGGLEGTFTATFCGDSEVTLLVTDVSGNSIEVTLTADVAPKPTPASIACVPVNVTIDAVNCEFPLTLQNVGNAQGLDCAGNTAYVIVNDGQIEAGERNVINGVGNFDYAIFSSSDELICWGTVRAEDKAAPDITVPDDVMLDCYTIDAVLNNANTAVGSNGFRSGGTSQNIGRLWLGWATATDCSGASISWADNIEYFNCGQEPIGGMQMDAFTGQRLYARITRRWTAVDPSGFSTSAIQLINFFEPRIEFNDVSGATPLDPNTFAFRPYNEGFKSLSQNPAWTFGLVDGKWVLEYSTCNPQDVSVPEIWPSAWSKNDIARGRAGIDFYLQFLDGSLCNYSVSVDKRRFDNVCGDGYKEERSIKVFDWCAGMTIGDFKYTVKVGDFDAPDFAACVLTESDDLVDFSNYSLSDPQSILDALNDNDITPDDAITSPEVCMEKVSTGPMNCTAAINSSLAGLRSLFGQDFIGKNECSELTTTVEVLTYGPELISGFPTGDSIWTIGGYVRNNNMIVGLPKGFHALIINAADGCYNSSVGIVFFEVVDKVKPIMKCDDELRVTLVEGDAKTGIKGYALVSYQDVDEGSWDNCNLAGLQVRRLIGDNPGAVADWEAKNGRQLGNRSQGSPYGSSDPDRGQYTPWGDIVEFFCADVDNPVKVELRGWDHGYDRDHDGDIERDDYDPQDDEVNRSICWLNVDVENGLNTTVGITGGGYIYCDQELTQENVADYATLNIWGMQCGGPEVGFRIVPELDECGFGRYLIYPEIVGSDDSKNDDLILDGVAIVNVVERHNYWVKFPADETLSCGDVEEYNGVETSEAEDVSCDLLAVYVDQNPERFIATSDADACYKLFQTYKVINWCEYDGESLPVIVSRDWDAHNANTSYDNTRVDRNFFGGNNDRANWAAGEYNLNPQEPDGDGRPGNTDLYVIVEIDDLNGIYNTSNGSNRGAGAKATVYYDNDSNPYNTSTANLWGDDDVNFFGPYDWPGASRVVNGTRLDEGYWWAVTRENPDSPANESAWYDDEDNRDGSTPPNDNNGFDIDGSDAQDDDDHRYGSFGYWQYTQHIIVYDDSAPVVDTAYVTVANGGSIDNATCDAAVELTVEISDECSVADIVISVFNGSTRAAVIKAGAGLVDNGDGTATGTWVPSSTLPIGSYKWTLEVNDGCGNITSVDVEFDVEDVKAPAPICHDGLRVELMPTADGMGMAAVWASDFKASDIGDCSGQLPNEPVSLTGSSAGPFAPKVSKEAYSIYREEGFGDDTYVSLLEDPAGFEAVKGLTVTCDDLAADGSDGMIMVRVYAEDAVGNADYCSTFIQVQNNNGACGTPAPGQIAGAIATETNATVEGVEVQLSGARSMMYMTNADGNFVFSGLALGGDYTVTPQMDVNHLNGVSTFDLVLISKHILGVQPLNSPYKLIAADVNNSKSVTTLDLIQLRKLILNIDTEFANNTSWRFVDAAHTFATPSNPWATTFPEFRNMNNLTEDMAAAQFVGIKVGDVNNSANVEARSANGTFAINAAERSMVAGNEYTVTFNADMKDIEGYQFTLNVKDAEIVDLVYGAAKAENFGVFAKEGVITTSFNGDAAGELFSLVIRATKDVNLSQALSVNSRYTAAEAYNANAEQLNVALNFTGATAEEAAFSLTQNTPNPFQGETVIGFNLPTAGEAQLTIQDVAGRTVKMIEGDFTKGYNQVTLNASDLPSAGVFFYTLTAGELSATKKMIVIDAVNR